MYRFEVARVGLNVHGEAERKNAMRMRGEYVPPGRVNLNRLNKPAWIPTPMQARLQ
jgi:hypothetical protein